MTEQILKARIRENLKEGKFFLNNVILDYKNVDLFFRYISERHRIFKKKSMDKKPSPWTKDPILKKYKFTNVFRDLDTGTRYVIEKIIPHCDFPEKVIFNLIIYRLYNKIETFEVIGIQDPYEFNHKVIESELHRLMKLKIPVFTNAFTVSSYHWINPNNDKISNTAELLSWIQDEIEVITSKIMEGENSEVTYKTLLSIKGIGKFLAYQIAVDIGYWNKEVFNESKFVVAGPGCRKGIDYVFQSRGDLSYEESIFYIETLQDELFDRVDVKPKKLFSDREIKKLNVMAIENCFCEISKYLKAYYGEGRPRNLYIQHTTLDEYI